MKPWFILTFLIGLTASTVANELAVERRSTVSNIQNGLTLAKEVGDFIVSKEFTNTIGKLATAVTPFLGIVGPLLNFVVGFFHHTESAELKAIKQLHKDVMYRFDKVDSQFNEVKNLINWSKIQIQYAGIEQKIHAVSGVYENIFTFSSNAIEATKKAFISNYESDYQNSGAKLYDGIMNEGRVFGEDLLQAAMKYTQNDRAKVQTFMLGLLKLLMKVSEIELAYHQLSGHTAALNDYKRQWETRLSHVRSKFASTDRTLKNAWSTQYLKDLEEYAKTHRKSTQNNNDFCNALYAKLQKKFYWRDWLVVTYNDITGGDKHWSGACGGVGKFRYYDRNLIIASVDHNKAHVSSTSANAALNAVHSCESHKGYCRPNCGTIYHRIDAHSAYDTFPASVKDHCSPFAAQGVIRYTDDVHFQGGSRLFIHSNSHCNHVFVFG